MEISINYNLKQLITFLPQSWIALKGFHVGLIPSGQIKSKNCGVVVPVADRNSVGMVSSTETTGSS